MEEELLCFTSENARHRLILLHGWGADAEDLIPLGENIALTMNHQIELISLRAPNLHPEGIGRQWYGLFPPEWNQTKKAKDDLEKRIRKLDNSKINLNQTVLLGFSQGGAMALDVGSNLPLAGIICCSAYPHPDFQPTEVAPPIFLTHGIQDQVVPIEAAKKIYELFKKINRCIELRQFDGGHEIPSDLIPEIRSFIGNCFDNI